jgi:hypothetical protein
VTTAGTSANVDLHRDQATCPAPTNDVAAGCLLVPGSSRGLSVEASPTCRQSSQRGNLLRELAGRTARCRAKLASPLADTSGPVADKIAARECWPGQRGRVEASPLLLRAAHPRSAFSRSETKMHFVGTDAKAADNNCVGKGDLNRTTTPPTITIKDTNKHGGSAVNQTVAYSVWLCVPGVVLIWATITIWRARRILSQARRDDRASEGGLLASLVEETGYSAATTQRAHLSR